MLCEQQPPAVLTIASIGQRPHRPFEARFRVEANRRHLQAENATELVPVNERRFLRAEVPPFYLSSIHWSSPAFEKLGRTGLG